MLKSQFIPIADLLRSPLKPQLLVRKPGIKTKENAFEMFISYKAYVNLAGLSNIFVFL